MKCTRITLSGLYRLLLSACILSLTLSGAQAASESEMLQKEVESLRQQLKLKEQQLAASEMKRVEAERALDSLAEREAAVVEKESKYANAADLGPSKITPGDLIPALDGLKIGGAIRANYAIGDYPSGAGPTRGGEGGNFGLDTFRINADYSYGDFVAKLEYRWHDGYNMLHTGWFGYNFQDESQLQVGVNRVPFGPGPYGVSQSWLFDQHYYVGLSDDMDLGVKYSTSKGDWSFDLAYYYSDEGNWRGTSRDSARYSYDVVDETGNGYEERNQFNARAIYATQMGEIDADLGASAQFGFLESNGPQDDGDQFALSFHPVFKWNNWTLAPQLTYYSYDIDDAQPLGTDDLVQLGAYDFASLIAAEAWIPAISLSYYYETPQVDWLDYIIPYIEYSSIIKEEDSFNDSEMFIIGSAFARGGWFIYADLAFSNGNDFVGSDAGFGDPTTAATANDDGIFQSNRLGANPTDEWETRFNINFGYYF
jgi:hypothetical protein